MTQRILFGVICLLGSLMFSVAAETPVTLFPESAPETTDPIPDTKDKGHRTAPRPVVCIIDMDKKTNKACPLNVTNLADYLWEHYLCKKSRKG
ncbi:hypothetical protein EEL50_01480 [Muribaculaceae bacterium Isolate-105 (HZI)]|nr:hypothetical protein EEL50_01480 [Muribaculaceae bacterium Isolate-105 (HZI)]